MPMYDRICDTCASVKEDSYERIADNAPHACFCGGSMLRGFVSSAANVIQDSIEGGLEIRHGLCEPGGAPKKYYSKSEIRREAAARGMTNLVEHKGTRGGDRSPHTTRWV